MISLLLSWCRPERAFTITTVSPGLRFFANFFRDVKNKRKIASPSLWVVCNSNTNNIRFGNGLVVGKVVEAVLLDFYRNSSSPVSGK
jgi:hypothetical protein